MSCCGNQQLVEVVNSCLTRWKQTEGDIWFYHPQGISENELEAGVSLLLTPTDWKKTNNRACHACLFSHFLYIKKDECQASHNYGTWIEKSFFFISLHPLHLTLWMLSWVYVWLGMRTHTSIQLTKTSKVVFLRMSLNKTLASHVVHFSFGQFFQFLWLSHRPCL